MSESTGSAVKGFISLAFFGLLAIVVLSFVFGTIVHPGYMGVRQITFGPSRGFSEKGLLPGYHWSFPLYSKIHMVPRKMVILDMHREGESFSRDHSGTSVEIQTTDGSSVRADLSLLCRYHTEPGVDEDGNHHGGPGDLIQLLGFAEEGWDTTITRVAVDEVKQALGKMSTSEFYNPGKREALINEAHLQMNKRLSKYGIRIEAALLRRYTYTEDRITNAIFQKNLQDQEERLNAAAGKFSKAKADLESVAAEMDARIQSLKVEGTSQSQVIMSEGDLYETEQVAKGDLLVAQADADIRKQKAELLSAVSGADTYIARGLVPLLATLKGGIVTSMDPYDLNGWLRRFGVSPEVSP